MEPDSLVSLQQKLWSPILHPRPLKFCVNMGFSHSMDSCSSNIPFSSFTPRTLRTCELSQEEGQQRPVTPITPPLLPLRPNAFNSLHWISVSFYSLCFGLYKNKKKEKKNQ